MEDITFTSAVPIGCIVQFKAQVHKSPQRHTGMHVWDVGHMFQRWYCTLHTSSMDGAVSHAACTAHLRGFPLHLQASLTAFGASISSLQGCMIIIAHVPVCPQVIYVQKPLILVSVAAERIDLPNPAAKTEVLSPFTIGFRVGPQLPPQRRAIIPDTLAEAFRYLEGKRQALELSGQQGV